MKCVRRKMRRSVRKRRVDPRRRMGKREFQARLAMYAAAAGAGVVAAGNADAVVQVTDLGPGVVVALNSATTSYALDMNNDGSTDFVLGFYGVPSTSSSYRSVTAEISHRAVKKKTATTTRHGVVTSRYAPPGKKKATKKGYRFARAFAYSQVIRSDAYLDPYGRLADRYAHYSGGQVVATTTYATTTPGPWLGRGPQYAGVKFYAPDSGATLSGWLRLEVFDDGDDLPAIRLTKYAFESRPYTPIGAGHTRSIPEPAQLGVLALGAAGIAAFRRHRQKKATATA